MMMMIIMVIIMIMIVIMMMMMKMIIIIMMLMMMIKMIMMMMMISIMTLTGTVRDVVLTVGSICQHGHGSVVYKSRTTHRRREGTTQIFCTKYRFNFFNWLKPLTSIRGKETGNHKRQAEENTADCMQTIQAVTLTAGKVHCESTTETSRIHLSAMETSRT